MRSLLTAVVFAVLAQAQSELRNSVSFSGGYGRDVNAFCCQTDTAPSLGVTYGFRVLPVLQLEAGVTTALNPVPEIRGANYDIKPDNRFFWVPFGVRGILPLRRAELSLAGGGLYDKFSVSNPNSAIGLASRDGWGGYFAAGAAVALDPGRHFWLGASPRFYLANSGGGYTHDRWFVIAGDLSFRF